MSHDVLIEGHSGYVRDAWYVLALSGEVGRELTPRTIMGEPVVFYRTEAGAPVALFDACAHRKFPLSKSRLVGDAIQCGYHGFEFGETGACIRIPSTDRIPPQARVRAYPVQDRHGFLWIWMGAAADADATRIVDCSAVGQGTAVPQGYNAVRCYYQSLIENLLDFSHLAFVHAANQGHPGNAIAVPEVRVDNGVVIATRRVESSPSAPLHERVMGIVQGTPIHHDQTFEFHPPGVVLIKQRITVGDTGQSFAFSSNHFLAPRDTGVVHYWAVLVQDWETDEAWRQTMAAAANAVVAEDLVVLEAQHERYQQLHGRAMNWPEASIPLDRPSLMSRQVLRRLAGEGAAARSAAEQGRLSTR